MDDQTISQPQDIDDPCVKICVRDRETQICLGCGRSGAEIDNWQSLSEDQRHMILAEKEARLAGLTDNRRKARRGRAKRTDAR